LNYWILIYGRRKRGAGGDMGIFIHGANIEERSLKVLFFGVFFAIFRSFFPLPLDIFLVFFSVAPPSPKIFLPTLLYLSTIKLVFRQG